MLPFPLLPYMLSEGRSMGFIIACLHHTLEIHLSLPHPGDYFAKSWSSVVCFFGGVPGRQYTLTDGICFACLGYLGEGQSRWSRALTRKASGRGRASTWDIHIHRVHLPPQTPPRWLTLPFLSQRDTIRRELPGHRCLLVIETDRVCSVTSLSLRIWEGYGP